MLFEELKSIKKIETKRYEVIYMRDPFIFTDHKEGCYYLFGTTSVCDGVANIEPHFEVYKSTDLREFTGPYITFYPKVGFWGVKHYWAPEVFEYNNKYYLFGSFKGGIGVQRGTSILVSIQPYGPYEPLENKTATLEGSECLDGTLYIDKLNNPWIIFCNEWTELYYGTILGKRLNQDLTSTSTKELITLVDTKNDDLPWIRKMVDPRVQKDGYLTDAPCLHRDQKGDLYLLWSSYSIKGYKENGFGGYVVASLKSTSGDIQGPWVHQKELLLDENIGHISLFRTLENELYMVGHNNDTLHGNERVTLRKVNDQEGILIEGENT